MVIAAITCSVALIVRLVLEAHAPSLIVTLAVLTGAAVSWSLAMLWTMAEPDFEPLRELLPRACVRLIHAFHATLSSLRFR